MPRVNPEILRWARETAGLALEDAAEKVGISEARGVSGPERLAGFENGAAEPSRPLLLRMAQQYRRPLLTFYLTEPPRRGERGEDFRTLPEHSPTQDALVDALIRDVRARQEMVKAILEEDDEARRLPFVGSASRRDGIVSVLASIQTTLNINVERYRSRLIGERSVGFAYLREQAERAGIYILLIGNLGSHHSALDVDIFRGFALADEIAPFVVINDQDAETAWAFTLLHELCHIWLGATGVSGEYADTAIERFCNDVASRFFLPAAELNTLRNLRGLSFENIAAAISTFAEPRRISRSMVAYRLYREEIINRELWARLTATYRRQWASTREAQRERNREREGGPNYYVVRRHRLGEALISFARRMITDRALSPTKAAKILGVKPNNVYPLVNVGPEAAQR